MTCCILGTAVVQAVVIQTGILDGQCPLLVVDLVALFSQLYPILEPLTCRSGRIRSRDINIGCYKLHRKHKICSFFFFFLRLQEQKKKCQTFLILFTQKEEILKIDHIRCKKEQKNGCKLKRPLKKKNRLDVQCVT